MKARLGLYIFSIIFLGACGTPLESPEQTKSPTEKIEPSQTPVSQKRLPTPTPFPKISVPPLRGPLETFRIPNFSISVPFDGIPPIYDPQFVNAIDAPFEPDELVIGISLNGEAKAYSVTTLRYREMVNDEIGGIPILVTW
jgi:hypothetical protein